MRVTPFVFTIFSTTALTALTALPAAADCIDDGISRIDCNGTGNTAIVTGDDGKEVRVFPGAELGPLSGIAISLSGDNQAVNNEGLIESSDDEALRVTGSGFSLSNRGSIAAPDDRAIRLQGAADNAFIQNETGGTITSKDQTIRADNGDNIENLTVLNNGTIESVEGRAIQSRGPGTTVINTGTIIGGEEVIEARTGFALENRGTIRIREGVADEDGVQFATGQVDNFGLIQGSDDGIDVDEGRITNHAGGIIRVVPAPGEPGGNGVDADEETQDPVNGDRAAGVLTIENAGLIEGPKAIGVDVDRTATINLFNSGTLFGTSGIAVAFNPGMESSAIEILDSSIILGDVLLTDSDDMVTVGPLSSGQMIDTFFDGRGGTDEVFLDGYALTDVTGFEIRGADTFLTLATITGDVSGLFRNFETWTVGGATYATAELGALAPIPLPAGLPLLAAGLGGLWSLRRRAA